MALNATQVAELAKPLNARNVVQRKQAGRQLSYIEGWHAIAEANRIFGYDGWHRETIEMREVRAPEQVKSQGGNTTWRVGFICKVRIRVGDITREGTGYGSGSLPDLGEAYESAVKEAETDAMKRALMTFGNPFGLALYDKAQANVEADAPARSSRPAKPAEDNPFTANPIDAVAADEAVGLLKQAKTLADLSELWKSAWIQSVVTQAPPEIANAVIKAKDDRKAALTERQAA